MPDHDGVAFDCVDVSPGIEQATSQCAESRADFDDLHSWLQLCHFYGFANEVGIDQKVLAKALSRSDTQSVQVVLGSGWR